MINELKKALNNNQITELVFNKTIDYIVNGNYSRIADLTVKAVKKGYFN